MSRKKISADEIIKEFNIDLDALFDEYMHNTGAATAKKFGLVGESYVKKILSEKGYDLSARNASMILINKTIKENNVDIDALYNSYLHNGTSYVSREFNISSNQIVTILKANGYDLSKRDPIEKLENRNGYAVSELIKKYNINPSDLYETYLNNGKIFTAKQFGLSNWHLVERILEAYGYDLSVRDGKKINVKKTQASLLQKYGVKHALQIPESKEKLKNTIQEKYGCDSYMETSDFKEKSKKTNLEKYGYEWSTQSPEVKLHHDNANYLKYGVKDSKQSNASAELKKYLNDKEKSIEFLKANNFTFFDLKKYFSEDAESQLYAWLYRFKLFEYLMHSSKSGPEKELAEYLKSYGFTELNNRHLLGNGQEIDIYNPDLKIGVEFNGIYYHSSLMIHDKNYHLNKSKLAEKRGIRLIHIYENEWLDLQKQNIIKSLLTIACGKVNRKIYARKCTIREIDNKTAKAFNNKNHLQGHRNAQITYGLFYKDELVQLMSFSKTKYNKNLKSDNDWEIIRGCPGSNNIVIGGVSKLFKHFIEENNPDRIFSYCDFNKFDGNGYEAIGMKFIGYTGPDKKWVIGYNVVNRNPHKYHEYKEKATACLWGAGSKKYLWEKPDITNKNIV